MPLRAPAWLRPAALCLLASALCSSAASLTTETFNAGLNGWTNQNTVLWTASVQTVRARFAAQSPPGLPQTASLVATSSASGGAFVGDYRAAGAYTMGFSFLAENALPAQVKLELISGTNTYFQELSSRVGATGVWHRFMFGLEGKELGGWVGAGEDAFLPSLEAVDAVVVRVSRNGTAAQVYRIDDFFLDGLPYASGLGVDTAATARVTWSGLRSNYSYRVQTAISPGSNYVDAVSFTATGAVHTAAATNAPSAAGVLRLIW